MTENQITPEKIAELREWYDNFWEDLPNGIKRAVDLGGKAKYALENIPALLDTIAAQEKEIALLRKAVLFIFRDEWAIFHSNRGPCYHPDYRIDFKCPCPHKEIGDDTDRETWGCEGRFSCNVKEEPPNCPYPTTEDCWMEFFLYAAKLNIQPNADVDPDTRRE